MKVSVWIEIKGIQVYVGYIEGTNSLDACFSYSEEYINNTESRPISIRLPLESRSFDARQTRCFFEGLLPEGFTRRCVAEEMNIDVNDYLTILSKLGNECLGAIRIVADDNMNEQSKYIELSDEQLKAFAREGAAESAVLVTKSHLSLTGASGKTGLYYDEVEGKWYLPVGSAPSNYIVKQSHVRLEKIVVNEKLCLLTASKLGIRIPDSFVYNLGEGYDKEVLFATKRYDRLITDDNMQIDNHQIPYRLHQEDFSQALGIPAYKKYEKDGDDYICKMFDLIKNYSSNPLEDQQELWNICIFNYLIGNTDNHIKNLSLLYSEDLKSIRLAPAYDIVSTLVYESSTENMALSIGGIYDINKVTRESFELEAKKVGLGVGYAMKQYDKMVREFPKALEEAMNYLMENGYDKVSDIADKIMERFERIKDL